MRMLLELKKVKRSYEGPSGSIDVLRGVSISIGTGEALAILGPSGSGKSTLLNLIGGLDVPTSGQVLLDGRDLATMTDDELAGVRNTRIGFVFQAHHLLAQLTVRENVLVPALVAGVTGAVEARARRLLDRVGLSDRLEHTPGALSGGERQRVAVVRALVNAPDVLLADEPTGSLDRVTGGDLGDLLLELNREEKTALVVVTHSTALARRMDRVLSLQDGTTHEAREPQ
jgi:ABC-type lipoprotein export system ATPase subunit